MSLSAPFVRSAPPWYMAAVPVIFIHAVTIAWMVTGSEAAISAPGAEPLAVMLAPPASAVMPSPADVAVAQEHRQSRVEPDPPPETPPQLVQTAHGAIAAVRPSPISSAPATPARSDPARVLAAPPPAPAPPGWTTSAPVEGASTTSDAKTPSWEAQILARLEKAKRYPDSARAGHMEDTIVISFTVDPDGRTRDVRVRRSAGFEELEAEAVHLVARVSPLPVPPDRIARKLSVPIEFYLRR